MELGRRQRAVLFHVVERFIASGEPVASRHVAGSARIGLSPATVRAVMAELEAEGYLTRGHKSAGCEPTDRAFRLYVDAMPAHLTLPLPLRRQLQERLTALRRELVEDLAWVARLVADVTHEAGVAVRPLGERSDVEAVSLVPLAPGRALGVVVTTAGGIEKRLVSLPVDLSADELQVLANQLTHRFHGRDLAWVRANLDAVTADAAESGSAAADPVAEALARELFASTAAATEVEVAGTENLLMSDDFAEVSRVRSVVALLQDRQRLVAEWRQLFATDSTRVVIGEESAATEPGRLGMVATLFFRDGRQAGAVGVVGSRRMDYLRIVPVVEFVGDTLTHMLDSDGAVNG